MVQIARSAEFIGSVLASFSVRRKWLTICLCALLTMLGGYGAQYLKFSGDYQIFFGSENPELKTFLEFEGTYGKADNIAFVVIPREGGIYQPSVIEAVHDITTRAWLLPFVSRVDSLTNFQHSYAEGDELIVEDLIFDKGEIERPGQMQRLQSIAENEPLLHQFITAPNGQATIVNAVLQVDRKKADQVLGAAEQAKEISMQIMAEYPNLEIRLIGANMISSAFTQVAEQDSATLIPLMYLVIILVMFFVLRSLSATLTGVTLVILSTVFGLGIGGWLGVEFTPISIAAPTIILTIAIADSVHVIAALRQRMLLGVEKAQALIEAVSTNAFPISITSITTIAGFLSLNFSDSPPFNHLGNITAAGIFMAWILSLTFLPAMLSLLPLGYRHKEGASEKNSIMRAVGIRIAARRNIALGATTAACLIAIAMIPRIELDDVWSKYFAPSIDIRKSIDATQPYFGTETIEFVIDTGRPGAVLEPDFLNDVEAFSEYLRQQDVVVHVYSVSDIMKRLNKNLNQDQEEFYAIPITRKKASQYLLVYELSLPYGLDLNDRIDIDRQQTRITVNHSDMSTVESQELIKNAQVWFDANKRTDSSLSATGTASLFNYIAARNIESMAQGGIFLIVAIFMIMAVSFRSLGIGVLSLLLNVIPILVAVGIWAVISGKVGFSIAVVGAVAIGLVIDYTVHLISKYISNRKHRGKSNTESILYAFDTAGTAIVATTVILVAGFGLLSTSAFKPNADLGLLTAIAITLAMIINFLVMPALLSFNLIRKDIQT